MGTGEDGLAGHPVAFHATKENTVEPESALIPPRCMVGKIAKEIANKWEIVRSAVVDWVIIGPCLYLFTTWF